MSFFSSQICRVSQQLTVSHQLISLYVKVKSVWCTDIFWHLMVNKVSKTSKEAVSGTLAVKSGNKERLHDTFHSMKLLLLLNKFLGSLLKSNANIASQLNFTTAAQKHIHGLVWSGSKVKCACPDFPVRRSSGTCLAHLTSSQNMSWLICTEWWDELNLQRSLKHCV